MALCKEPLRRYASVEQYSEDIRRYLEGRPVIARSDTFGYRAARFLRRNVVAVAAATVAVVTLFGATIFELRSATRAAQRDSVAEQRLKVIEAESRRQQIELSNAYFALAESQDPRTALVTYRSALATFREFERTHPGDPLASSFIAHTAMKVGDLAPEEALDLYTEAHSRMEPLAKDSPGDYFASFQGLGRAQFKNHDVLGALASFSRALQVAEAHGNRRDIASSNFWVGTVLAYNGETEAGAAKLPRLSRYIVIWRTFEQIPRKTRPPVIAKLWRIWLAQAPPDTSPSHRDSVARVGLVAV